MFSAFDKVGNRVNAIDCTTGEVYRCPVCEQEVQLKKGRIRIPHFAHIKSECTDSWTYEMTAWHRRMQGYFPPEVREVVVQRNGKRHRADILCDGIVVEFQHSPISVDEFNARNDFYEALGYRVAWVFNLDEQYKRKQIYFSNSYDKEYAMKWNDAYKIFSDSPLPKDDNKKFSVWLTWQAETEADELWKVTWSSKDNEGGPDYKRIFVSSHYLTLSNDTKPEEFFLSKNDHLRSRLKGYDNYTVKTSGMSGKSRDKYICPISGVFLKVYGSNGCRQCRHCIAVDKRPFMDHYYEVYCYFPRIASRDNEGYRAPEY